MNSSFPVSRVEVLHGDSFSVFSDESGHYWVISNSFPRVHEGPFSFELAREIMISSNQFFNLYY